jgi:hypothetical protein
MTTDIIGLISDPHTGIIRLAADIMTIFKETLLRLFS